eukprot:970446-Lingulodinium_polyedra.AAC.1
MHAHEHLLSTAKQLKLIAGGAPAEKLWWEGATAENVVKHFNKTLATIDTEQITKMYEKVHTALAAWEELARSLPGKDSAEPSPL